MTTLLAVVTAIAALAGGAAVGLALRRPFRYFLVQDEPPRWAGAERVDGDVYRVYGTRTRWGAERGARRDGFRVVKASEWNAEH